MILRLRFSQGIFQPNVFADQFRRSKEIYGLWSRLSLLFFLTIIIFATEAFYGIGTEALATELANLTNGQFEARKLLFGLGHVLFGMVYAAVIIFLPALTFWTFLELPFTKLLVIQAFMLAILLTERALLIPITIHLGIDASASPFAFGIISRELSLNDIVTHFFGILSIFKIIAVTLQYKMVRLITTERHKDVLLILLGVNILFWVISALLSYIQFEKIF